MTDKTHYRKVFKSDHLGIADLEDFLEAGSDLIFTIKEVRQQYGAKVAGKKIDCNIAYFKEDIKPLVLNATNSKTVKGFAKNSPFVEDWQNIPVRLYIDSNVKMKGEVVGGVRINPNQPAMKKPELTPENKTRWDSAKTAFKRDGNLVAVLKRAEMSEENQRLLMDECKETADA